MTELDSRFYTDLGIPKSVWVQTNELTWDIWIQHYFDHLKSLQLPERSKLHSEIDRFWFMVEENKYYPPGVVVFDPGGKKVAQLLAKHRIQSPVGQRADLWLKIAGAYLEGLKRKENETIRQGKESPNIEVTIPPGWLDHPDNSKRGDAYNFWLKTLTEGNNWSRFVNSYKNDVHGVTVVNASICASLRSFVNQRYMEKYWNGREVKNYGKPLLKPPGQRYWPKALGSFNTVGGGWYLYQAVENEYISVTQCQATADGRSLQSKMPPWLTIGYDPLKHPPVKH